MSDIFTKAKRSEVMSRIRRRGNKDTELALARLLRANGITGWRRQVQIVGRVASPVELASITKGGAHGVTRPTFRVRPDFVFRKLQARTFRGRLLLAWLSPARDQAGKQPCFLEKETGREQNPRPAGEPDVAPLRLARHSNLGM